MNTNEQDAISQVVQHYIDGAKSGKGDDMRPAFHEDATIFGYVGPDQPRVISPSISSLVRPASAMARRMASEHKELVVLPG